MKTSSGCTGFQKQPAGPSGVPLSAKESRRRDVLQRLLGIWGTVGVLAGSTAMPSWPGVFGMTGIVLRRR
ncbi:hypothetical protein [Sandarakinorhabdus sp.]|uniref:hypothetical protein n=1 Tax=Sandarakinorhabdus sp. TaxID=1916663 RepID=UPI003F727646